MMEDMQLNSTSPKQQREHAIWGLPRIQAQIEAYRARHPLLASTQRWVHTTRLNRPEPQIPTTLTEETIRVSLETSLRYGAIIYSTHDACRNSSPDNIRKPDHLVVDNATTHHDVKSTHRWRARSEAVITRRYIPWTI